MGEHLAQVAHEPVKRVLEQEPLVVIVVFVKRVRADRRHGRSDREARVHPRAIHKRVQDKSGVIARHALSMGTEDKEG